MAKRLTGKEVTLEIETDIIRRVSTLNEKGVFPTLAIVRVGSNPSDMAYENSAVKKAEKLGIKVEKYIAEEEIEEEDLISVIDSINDNDGIHGVLLFRPLPKHIDENRVRNVLSPEKDLDGITDSALAGVFSGRKVGFPPCTAGAAMEILKYYDCTLKGKRAVVIGRSMVIGRPVAMMLMAENATVTICHTGTEKEDLKAYCKNADIIISSAGHINTLTEDMVSSGQIIIDVGINFNNEGKMTGDVDFANVSGIVEKITPVPGGVGSVTTTLLMKHLIIAAEKMKH